MEALKRELTDDSSSSSSSSSNRAILRDRLAEKGPAPSPPVINKTREVDYVGFAKYVLFGMRHSSCPMNWKSIDFETRMWVITSSSLFCFFSLPNQVYRRAVKKGFEFTLMVVGESGLGKSTLINSMFLADIYSPEYPGPSHRIKKTVQVCLAFLLYKLFLFFKEKKKEEKQNNRFYFYFYFDWFCNFLSFVYVRKVEQCQALLKENGVNLTLTVVDTPGFGDAVDNSNWCVCFDHLLCFFNWEKGTCQI